MKYTTLSSLLVIVAALSLPSLSSCHKEVEITGGGKGGNAVLIVTPEAHNYYVDSSTVYIKYGTWDAPLDGVYDDSMVCMLQDTVPVATFSNLKIGRYYIYGHGYHAGYTEPFAKGGQPYTIFTEKNQTYVLQLGPYTP